MTIDEQIKKLIDNTCKKLKLRGESFVSLSPRFEFGDYCATVAEEMGKIKGVKIVYGARSQKLNKIKKAIEKSNFYKKYISRIEFKEPVFINFFVKPIFF